MVKVASRVLHARSQRDWLCEVFSRTIAPKDAIERDKYLGRTRNKSGERVCKNGHLD